MKTYRKFICALSAVLFAVTPLGLHAEMVDTATMLSVDQSHATIADWRTNASAMDASARESVRLQLEAYGVSPDLAAERVAAMTDSQLQELSLRMQDLPAGSGALGIVATVLVIVLLLEILGITNISGKV